MNSSPVDYTDLQKSVSTATDPEDIYSAVKELKEMTSHIPAMMKSQDPNQGLSRGGPSRGPKAVFFDPLSLQYSLGYKDRRYSLTYDTLKRIAAQVSIISAIINTRIAQIASFSEPYRITKSLGFRVKHKSPDHETTDGERDFIEKLEAFILSCGEPGKQNPFTMMKRPKFETFIKKIVRDTLTYDQIGFEVVPRRNQIPFEFWAADGSTLRIASPDQDAGMHFSYHHRNNISPTLQPHRFDNLYVGQMYGDRGALPGNNVRYVQVVNGQIENVYGDELAFGVRNPRSDIYIQGYGYGELEQLITIITSILYAEEFNRRNFSQGANPKGMLNFKGDNWTPDQLEAFRRQWVAQVAGVENSWKTPITQSEGIEWVDLQRSNHEMGYQGWLEYLIKITCFTPETKVVLGDGTLRRIDEVCPDDLVATHTGRVRRVKNVQVKAHSGSLMNIRAGNEVIRVTGEHPLYVCSSRIDGYMRRVFEEPDWVKAEDVVEGVDYLVVPKPRKKDPTHSRIDLSDHVDGCRVSGEKIRLDSNASKDVSRFIDLNERNAFVLGLYAAEGHSTNYNSTFCFSSDETSYAEAVEEFSKDHGLRVGDVTQKSSALTVRFYSGVFSRAFQKMFGRLAGDLVIPEEIRGASLEVQRAFLSGYIGGDGSVYKGSRNVTLSVTTKSKTASEQIKSMLLNFGVYAAHYDQWRKNGHHHHDLRVGGRQLLKVSGWLKGPKGDLLKKNLEEVGDRLRDRVYEKETYLLVPVVETWSENYKGEVFNLEVEKEHTYQVQHYAVHNCGVFLIDPAEINFDLHGGVQQTPLFESSQEWKLKASRDRGLKPILRFLASLINEYVIDKIDDHFVFEFAGLDELTEQEKHELLKEQIASYKTLNEGRRELDLPEVPGGIGDLPLNPTLIQLLQMQQQREDQLRQEAQQQEQMKQQAGAGAEAEQQPEEEPQDPEKEQKVRHAEDKHPLEMQLLQQKVDQNSAQEAFPEGPMGPEGTPLDPGQAPGGQQEAQAAAPEASQEPPVEEPAVSQRPQGDPRKQYAALFGKSATYDDFVDFMRSRRS